MASLTYVLGLLFCFLLSACFYLADSVSSTLPPLPQQQQLPAVTPSASTSQLVAEKREHGQETRQMPIIGPILVNLGFQELAMAVPALASPFLTAWFGPVTIFAPTDESVRSCISCSPTVLLREHIVPGLFSQQYLSKLAFGTKLETSSPGRCLTITTSLVSSKSKKDSVPKIFVDGIEVILPDMFNDGRIMIHGLQGFVTPLSPQSCNQDPVPSHMGPHLADGSDSALVRLMLRDAIVRLRDGGYGILALAMRVKYAELANLQNMTIFALDDSQIFSGGHSYVTSVKYHVVPNKYLMHVDLLKLPVGTTLPTLVHDQDLVVTHTSSGDPLGLGFRINYVPLKYPDVVYNVKVAIHTVFLPFPHLKPSDLALSVGARADDGIFGPHGTLRPRIEEKATCSDPSLGLDECNYGPSSAPGVSPLDLEDDVL